MHHKGTISLQTERLLLRRFVPEDAGAMYANWASDAAVTEFLTWPPHASVDVTRQVLESWIASYERADFYTWALELRQTGQLIGSISVTRLREDIDCAELGYCMGTKWWGQGLMPEAGRAVVRFLFDEVGCNRVAAVHAVGNPKSGRCMQKIGMRYEGTLRQAGFCNQGVIDEVWYSILREEYAASAAPPISAPEGPAPSDEGAVSASR